MSIKVNIDKRSLARLGRVLRAEAAVNGTAEFETGLKLDRSMPAFRTLGFIEPFSDKARRFAEECDGSPQ